MALLKEQDRQYLIKEFERLKDPVKILMFTQEMEFQYCRETHMIVDEIANLSYAISLEVHDFIADKELAEQHGIDKIPAIAILRS